MNTNELEALFTNMKSELTILDKQISLQCNKYKDDLNKQIKELKSKNINELAEMKKKFVDDLQYEITYNTKLIQNLYTDFLQKYKNNVKSDTTLNNAISALKNEKEKIIEQSKEQLNTLFLKFIENLKKSIDDNNQKIIDTANIKQASLEEDFTNYHYQLMKNYDNILSTLKSKVTIALDDIYSAEVTSIDNILKLKNKYLNEITLKVNGIDSIIQAQINSAIQSIADQKNNMISDIKKSEIEAIQGVSNELEKNKKLLKDELDILKNDLATEKDFLIQKLADKEHEISSHIDIFKGSLTIELNKVKQEVVADFTNEFAKFLEKMHQTEQKIYADVGSIPAQEVKEKMEQEKQNKLNEYIAQLNELIKNYFNQITKLYEDLKSKLTDYANIDLKNEITNFSNSKIEEIKQVKKETVDEINNYTSQMKNEITKTKDTSINIINTTTEAAREEFTEDKKSFKLAKDDILSIREESLNTINSTSDGRLKEIKNLGDDTIAKIGVNDIALYKGNNSVRKDAIDAIENKRLDSVSKLVDNARNEFVSLVDSLTFISEEEINNIIINSVQ